LFAVDFQAPDMALPIDQRIILIVPLTVIVIIVGIIVRILTGRKPIATL
jgi:hypothetical protein